MIEGKRPQARCGERLGDFSDWVSIRNCKETNMNIIKIMTPKALTVFLHTGDTVRQGLELLRQHGYTAIPVLNDQGEYLGSITEGDFLRHILAVGTTDRKAHEKYRIGGLLRPDFCPPLGIRATPDQVAQALLRQNFIPIVDDRNCFCGIVTRRSFMAFLVKRTDLEELEASPV